MKKVTIFSLLLILGLIGSQILPWFEGRFVGLIYEAINMLTLIGLAFIMIHVGYEFDIDKSKLRSYGWDYVVAMTAAAFPWIFVALYYIWVMLPSGASRQWDTWTEVLLVSRFAAPTSAGVLFSMLAAAGLSATWLFRKARILAIFDDLDTVLLMIPLTMLIIGPVWQLLISIAIIIVLLWIAWRYLHRLALPVTWSWVLSYSITIVFITEVIYLGSKMIDSQLPIHVEVLLPAFVLGSIMKHPASTDPHRDDERNGHQEGPEGRTEQRVSTIISGAFIFLVGLSMPLIFPASQAIAPASDTVASAEQMPAFGTLMAHVLIVTFLSNLGKMFPAFCYRKEAHWRERLAVAIGMWPRGEVGAGILVIAISYGISGPLLTVSALVLALNLFLTGVFIWIVKRLIRDISSAGSR